MIRGQHRQSPLILWSHDNMHSRDDYKTSYLTTLAFLNLDVVFHEIYGSF